MSAVSSPGSVEAGEVPTSAVKVASGEEVAEVPEVGGGPLKGDQLPGAGVEVLAAPKEVGVPVPAAVPPEVTPPPAKL